MGLFGFLKKSELAKGLEEFKATEGAVLLDVREQSEFDVGHIPMSRNLPVSSLSTAAGILADKKTPVFVCGISKEQSSAAAEKLAGMGYENVTDIGSVDEYKGSLRR